MNFIAELVIGKLNLLVELYSHPYKVAWQNNMIVTVTKQFQVSFNINMYEDLVSYDLNTVEIARTYYLVDRGSLIEILTMIRRQTSMASSSRVEG